MFAPADLFVINDTLDALLLGSFFFGLVFVVLSLTMGLAEIGFGHDHGGLESHGQGQAGGHWGWLAQLNIGSTLAFLTWFGGVAYLLRNAVGLNGFVSLIVGIAAGVACAVFVLRLMRILKSQEVYLDQHQERMPGVIGRVSSSVRADGTGEITYVLNGVRQVSAARTAQGLALPRGTEVVVLRRERGIAFVEPWNQESEEEQWERRFEADSNSNIEALPQPDR
jgi:membrane protein implicated in regulation of membrane protease activity